MLSLGLRFSLKGGREAGFRLAFTALGVAVGVALLLFTLSGFNGLKAKDAREGWLLTSADNRIPSVDETTSDALWWRLVGDSYGEDPLIRVEVAATGERSPVTPGLERLPEAGEYYVSPALARLIASTPDDVLRARFPGRQAGIIGDDGAHVARRAHRGRRPARRRAERHTRCAEGAQHRGGAEGARLQRLLQDRARARRRGAPHPGADVRRHVHAAGRRAARGALRSAPAGRRHAAAGEPDRLGRGWAGRGRRRGRGVRRLLPLPAPGGPHPVHRRPVLHERSGSRLACHRRRLGRSAARGGAGRSAVAPPRADLAARGEPARDAQAAASLASRARGRRPRHPGRHPSHARELGRPPRLDHPRRLSSSSSSA